MAAATNFFLMVMGRFDPRPCRARQLTTTRVRWRGSASSLLLLLL
jgi:hypothetical protein